MVYMGLRIAFDVRPPQPAPGEAPGVRPLAEAPADIDPAANLPVEADPDASAVAASPGDPGSGSSEDQPAVSAAESGEYDRQVWTTMGSMLPDSPHLMMVTTTNRGGGLERIELTERDSNGRLKYRRVDVRTGYLGYFAARPSALVDGVVVNVVGRGTPADLAVSPGGETGVRVGDVLVAVAGTPVLSAEEIDVALQGTEPGDEVTVEVRRPTENPDPATSGDGFEDIVFTATLTEHPLDLIRLASTAGPEQVPGNLNRLSCLMTLEKVNRLSIAAGGAAITGLADPARLLWTPQSDPAEPPAVETTGQQTTTYRLPMTPEDLDGAAEGLELLRSYTLTPGSYDLGMNLQIKNTGSRPSEVAYRLEGANGLTLEGWWYSNKKSPNWGGSAARDVVYRTTAGGHELISGFALLKQARNEPQSPAQVMFAPDGDTASRDLKYIGVDAQYFTVAYVPADGEPLATFRRASAGIVANPNVVPENQERAVNVSFALDSQIATLAPGQTLEKNVKLFAGPKRNELLAAYGLSDTLYYGWFSWPALILENLLHGLYALVGNYAVAIILLTVVVRGLMFPISRKAAVNAQKMQELAPEMKKIAEKYKDDMEGRLKAQRELQQRVGFNPMAGCLPMFLQLPIFIGLYSALSVDIELRQAAFASWTTWASNLAGPDMFAYWGDWLWGYLSGRGTGWLGPYFNVLPVIVMGLFLAQQKMFMPPATDEQTAMTQKIMSYMTLVMGLFFFRVPAGLCIYFITSSLWGICERLIVKRTLPEGKHFDGAVLEGTAEKPKTTSNKLADRIRQQMSPAVEPVERPNKRKKPVITQKGSGKKKGR